MCLMRSPVNFCFFKKLTLEMENILLKTSKDSALLISQVGLGIVTKKCRENADANYPIDLQKLADFVFNYIL